MDKQMSLYQRGIKIAEQSWTTIREEIFFQESVKIILLLKDGNSTFLS